MRSLNYVSKEITQEEIETPKKLKNDMNIVLLSGGSGKRLWPLSNDVRSKQFIQIFRRPDGTYESMAQRMYRGIRMVNPDANITIATSRTQVSEIRNQLGNDVNISIEPGHRDTFPAIVLACAYLQDKGVSMDEPVVICPVDPYVDDDYFRALSDLSTFAEKDETRLSLLGIEPTYPSEKYGYIIPESSDEISHVSEFKEKPSVETAEDYISQGALWNAGVFAFRPGYVLGIAHRLIDFNDYADLYARYNTLEKISFDYAVVEKEKSIDVMRFHGTWKDLGTWNTLTEAMDENIIGRAGMDDECKNTHIINDLDIPVLVMGLKNTVVCASPDGIFVSDKDRSSYNKPYVEKIEQPVMYAEKSWGAYQVIDVEKESMTIRITLLPGHSMNYHSHERRDEVWTIVSGTGRTILDGMEQYVKPGDVITMQAGCKHTVIADGSSVLRLIEVQLGKDISVTDKKKYRLSE